MAAAHSEALLALLHARPDDQVDACWAGQLLGGIAAVAAWGPATLASDGRLQAAVAQCYAHLPQASIVVAMFAVSMLRRGL